jgi:hypothetical protein
MKRFLRLALTTIVMVMGLATIMPTGTIQADSSSCKTFSGGPTGNSVQITVGVKVGTTIKAIEYDTYTGMDITWPDGSMTTHYLGNLVNNQQVFFATSTQQGNAVVDFRNTHSTDYTYWLQVCPPFTPLLNFNDGRCNQEPWQSFAVYPDGKGGYVFYAIYQGVGYYAMHVTEKDLDNNPDTGVNHIIAQSVGVQLWRLAGGALQATRAGMDSKLYSFTITCDIMEDGD